ncbi:N-acetylmuramoyl-L-alanine amidase [Baaleninema sp.]|uniref:N-acetylmuramoyl-L-alanine amidase n=1 Tax=Baaleninema sp. TaxID=3101197 RepID=UPI003D057C19
MVSMVAAAAVPVMFEGSARANSSLFVAYPPETHETTSDRIFIIGTADPDGTVTINGTPIDRSPAGHFAPSFPLTVGENRFEVRYGDRAISLTVVRQSPQPNLPQGVGFAEGSIEPSRDIARMPGELVCFSAVAPTGEDTTARVRLGDRTVALLPDTASRQLPENLAVLVGQNQPLSSLPSIATYRGCRSFETPGNLGTPIFELQASGETATQPGGGSIEILPRDAVLAAEIVAEEAIARTGPSTSHSRLTPLPRGTRARVTGKEGDWLRLDYGAWVRAEEARTFRSGVPPHSIVRSVSARHGDRWTEVFFPLTTPVPVSVEQEGDRLTLTLHNTTTQTDFIAFDANPWVEAMTWQQPTPDRAQYRFQFRASQQWGYKLRYDDTTLVLSLRHPPQNSPTQPLAGTTILLDPGHGGPEDLGARGPTGKPEKEVTLDVGLLLRDELERRGATVVMTREGDIDLWPHDRVQIIEKVEPTLALSLHYNALPDNGDAENTAGIGTFWYHPQARDLAAFLYRYLVEDLNRPEYGVFWANFALTRPTVTPSVLLELGFAINPDEFEWIVDPQAQQALAASLADGIEAWLRQQR